MPGTANPEAPGCTTCGALDGTPCDRAVHERVREAQERAMAQLAELEADIAEIDLSDGQALESGPATDTRPPREVHEPWSREPATQDELEFIAALHEPDRDGMRLLAFRTGWHAHRLDRR